MSNTVAISQVSCTMSHYSVPLCGRLAAECTADSRSANNTYLLNWTCIYLSARARDLLTSLFTILTLIGVCVILWLEITVLWNYKYVDFFCMWLISEFDVYDTALHSCENKHSDNHHLDLDLDR